MADKIPKHLSTQDRTEWTVEDHIEYARTGVPPLNPEWQERRDEALADAGIELDDDTSSTPVEEMTVEQHAARQARSRYP